LIRRSQLISRQQAGWGKSGSKLHAFQLRSECQRWEIHIRAGEKFELVIFAIAVKPLLESALGSVESSGSGLQSAVFSQSQKGEMLLLITDD